ncbi:hypothetical protein D3C85_980930 [compost metagenome]
MQNHQEKQTVEAQAALRKSLKVFNQLQPKEDGLEIDDAMRSYDFREVLASRFECLDFISYASVSQEKVGYRAVKKIRPFQEHDKGYRDTLIWLSLLDHISESGYKGEIVFINSNQSDFFEKNMEFYDDLKSDIVKYGLECSFSNYLTLTAFLQERVNKDEHLFNYEEVSEHYLMDSERLIQQEIAEHINAIATSDFLDMVLKQNSWFPNLPYASSHKFEIVEGIEDPVVLACRSLSDDLLYINYQFNLRICEIRFDIPFYHMVDGPDWMNRFFDIEELSDRYRLIAYRRIDVAASFNYRISSASIEGMEIEVFRLRKH